MTVEQHVLDDLPAFALGVLDSTEALQVEEHLGVCPACRAELRAFQQVVEELPLAVPQHEPPAHLKKRILTQASRQASVPSWPPRTSLLRRLAPAWGVFSLVLILALVIGNLTLWQRLENIEPPSQFQVIALTGTDYKPDASGALVVSPDGNEGTLVAANLPELDPAYQYQLWLIQDGQRTSGGVFSVAQGGYGYLAVTSPEPLLQYDGFGVTIEPAGGSPGPTGQKVLGGES